LARRRSALRLGGVDAVLFPGLAAAYELSLLLRGRRHPIGVRRLAGPVTLFAAGRRLDFRQASTPMPAAPQHPIWAMAADVLERPLDGSISVNRDLTVLALPLWRVLPPESRHRAVSDLWPAVSYALRASFREQSASAR
jgi:hypothetical protein